MSQRRLLDAVDRVESRVMRVGSWRIRTVCWCALAVVAAMLVASKRWYGSGLSGLQITGFLAGGVVLSLIVEMLIVRRRSVIETARDIEAAHPALDDTLLTALEQKAEWPAGHLRYLQTVVVEKALTHSTFRRWSDVVPAGQLRGWTVAGIASLVMFLVCSVFAFDRAANAVLGEPEFLAEDSAWKDLGDIAVEPGDTELESGSSLLVMARFEGEMPSEAWLNIKPKSGDAERVPMKLGHDKNLLLARVPNVVSSGSYSIDYDEDHTQDFKVSVYTVPALEQADAVISYPKYTKLPAKTVQDTHRVTVVEGSTVQWLFRLNKSVENAELRLADGTALKLAPVDGEAGSVRGVTMTATETRKYTLHLSDASGRENRFPPDIKLSVIENKRPDLKLAFPGKDQEVSPLEEMMLEAKVSDDFGLPEFGLIYGLAGNETSALKLGENAAAKVKHSALATLALEDMNAEPDQLVSYYFYADDYGPDGNVRRTLGDMYFAEVRKFEQIFRQGQQQQGQQQQQRQQQPQGQQQGQGQQMQQLAELQKQIMTATWNLVRRPSLETRDPQGVSQAKDDAKVLSASQETAKAQVGEMMEKLQDPTQQALAETLIADMDGIISQFSGFDDSASIKTLTKAHQLEQAVYQKLLKLRAREAQVRKQQQQQQQGQQGQQNQNNRSRQQMNQLELNNKRNRYEQEQQAQQEKPTVDQQQLRVLNRLKELARRQQAINEKLKQLESELRQAESDDEREEIERQLKRLRDEQQQMLRDLDETAEEVEKIAENLDNPDQVQQQAQQAREQARRTSEALKNDQVSKAISEGTRTERDLKELRDDLRKETAGEFEDAMRQMRQEVRDIENKQKEISDGLAEKKEDQRKTLRSDDDREQMTEDLQKQAERVAELSEQMREVVRQSEDTEPLLARKLYEVARELKDKPPEKDLEAERFLVSRGFMEQAREADKQARQGIEQMKKGIEQAAETVLGNELDGLRRAQRQLEQLQGELGSELAQNDPEAARLAQEAAEERARRDAERESEQQARSGYPNGQPREDEPQREGRQREGQQRSEEAQERSRNARGESQREGERNGEPPEGQRGEGGQPQDSDRPNDNQQREGQPGQQPRDGQQSGRQGNQRPRNGQPRNGQQPREGQPQEGQERDGQQREGQQPGEGQRPGDPQNPQRPGGLRNLQQQRQPQRGDGRGGNPVYAPLTGEEYKDWVDRMRDVEEMLDDPELRSDVARIRDRARGIRIDYKRHSKEPQWDLVRKELLKPMVELQARLNEEIAKRESKESLVPIDRDPVPNRYAEMVRRYYEELGRDHSEPVRGKPNKQPSKPTSGAEE